MLDHALRDEDARANPSGRAMLRPTVDTVAMLAVLGAILVVGLAPRIDTDLWWHLRTGQYILAHHAVPTTDLFSFTFAGRPWTDHEWLTEVLFTLTYRAAGLWGPIVVCAIVLVAAYALVYRALVVLRVNRIFAAFLVFVAIVPSSITWGPRPQMFSLLFLALFGLVLHVSESSGKRILWILPAAMVLWANLHGGWVLGLVVIGCFFGGRVLDRWTGDPAMTWVRVRSLGIVLLVTALVTAINPDGLREVTYPLVWLVPSAWSSSLNEWASTDFHDPRMMVFEAMLLLLLISVWVARGRPRWTHILLAVLFTYLALTEERNVAVWSVIVTPVLGLYMQEAAAALGLSGRKRPRPAPHGPRLVANLVLLGVIVVLYAGIATRYLTSSALRQAEVSTFPAHAVAYMQTHHLPLRLFNSYAWGGYVIWKLYPQYRDFIDGRANTVFDTRILGDYFGIYDASRDYERLLRRYRVQDVLVGSGSPIDVVLTRDARWHRVYGDTYAVVYVRR